MLKRDYLDNAVQGLISFKEGNRGLFKLQYIWGREVRCWKKRREFSSRWKKNLWEAIQNLLKSCLSYDPPKESIRIAVTKKAGETTE